jgi:hypothetical protein
MLYKEAESEGLEGHPKVLFRTTSGGQEGSC